VWVAVAVNAIDPMTAYIPMYLTLKKKLKKYPITLPSHAPKNKQGINTPAGIGLVKLNNIIKNRIIVYNQRLKNGVGYFQ